MIGQLHLATFVGDWTAYGLLNGAALSFCPSCRPARHDRYLALCAREGDADLWCSPWLVPVALAWN
jgi:hypothetical protein